MSDHLLEEVSIGLPRNYLRQCLLLLLAEGESHGYELLVQVTALGLAGVDPGGLYRCLRSMDEEGLVQSSWQPSTTGPARRIYVLTENGRDWLHAAAVPLSQLSRVLDTYQRRYRRLLDQPGWFR